ncbi:MAG: hypothetical protein U0470_04570 [Anaerolineae bacterium]
MARRLDVRAFAGDEDGGWALASGAGPGEDTLLLAVDAGRVRRWLAIARSPLRALARGGATFWAVGDDGATWWPPAGAAAWRPPWRTAARMATCWPWRSRRAERCGRPDAMRRAAGVSGG